MPLAMYAVYLATQNHWSVQHLVSRVSSIAIQPVSTHTIELVSRPCACDTMKSQQDEVQHDHLIMLRFG